MPKSRQVLTMQIETAACTKAGSLVTNFRDALPPTPSDLARDTSKDPRVFDCRVSRKTCISVMSNKHETVTYAFHLK
jgi:hypothetical protein